MNKPFAVGIAILGWSKAHMLESYYGSIKPKYQNKVHLHYTDTDSMFLAIETDDLYADIKNDEEFSSIFDFQTYKEEHPMFPFYPIVPFDLPSEPKYHELVYKNKDVLGKFKDEAKGLSIEEACFLRAKMYTFTTQGAKPVTKAKGVQGSAMKKVCHQMYKDCLHPSANFDVDAETKQDTDLKKLKQSCKFYRLGSKKHQIELKSQTKTSLSHYDDKRYYLDAIHSLPHGYKKIE